MFSVRTIFSAISSNTVNIIRTYKVTVVGAATDVGQTLCLMLKSQPNISNLTVFDTLPHTSGVGLDLSHIPTDTTSRCLVGEKNLYQAVKDANIVLAVGGTALTPGLTNETLLTINTAFIKTLCQCINKGPMPFIGIVTEPINSIVATAAEVLRGNGEYNPRKLFGITGLDALRAQTLYASKHKGMPCPCFVPVIGGHSEKTMIPLLSKSMPHCELDEKRIHEFTETIRKADDIITRAKRGFSPTLSPAFAALLFTREILSALDGQPTQVHALVENNHFGTEFFSGIVDVSQSGAGDMQRFTNLSQYEFQLLEESLIELRREVNKGRKILEIA